MIQSAMAIDRTARPGASEYAPYYATYIDKVPDGNVVERLARQIEDTTAILASFGDERGGHRYAEGKWSVKEVAGHLIDTERVFSYRAMRIARGDVTPLPGFDQDGYVRSAPSGVIPMVDLVEEWRLLRGSNVLLFRGLDSQAWVRRGTASEVEVTVRALAWMTAGHELHHAGLFRERYC